VQDGGLTSRHLHGRADRAFLALAPLAAAVPFLALSTARNGLWELCTTRAYGFPFPWYVAPCPCARGEPSFHPMYWLGNLALWLGASLVLAWALSRLRSRRTSGPAAPSG